MTETATSFEAFIAAERERLNSERAALWDQQKEIEEKLAAIDRELNAIKAYEAAKQGKAMPLPQDQKQEGAKPTRAPRGSGTGIRQQVLETIRKRDGGASAADLYAFLEAEDDKSRQAINNALATLKKEGTIQQERRRGPYTAVEHPEADQAA